MRTLEFLVLCTLASLAVARARADDFPLQDGDSITAQREVSPEGSAYLERLRQGTPFGANHFDLAGLRAGMGARHEPTIKGIQLKKVNVGDVPCEWVLAPGADPDVRLLYLHGGGWVSGSGGNYLPLAAEISQAGKCAVLLPDYRLAPEHPFPAGLDDCISAHDWLVANGPTGLGPAKATFIAGDSAGGNLTLATLLALRDRKRPLPAGAIAISPATDFTLASDSLKSVQDPIISARTMPEFRERYLGKTDPHNPLASPVFGDYRGLPPLLIQAGDVEMLRDDSIRAAKKAMADGIPVKLEVWPGMVHVFQIRGLPESREAIEHIGTFIHTHLQRELARANAPANESIGQDKTQEPVRPLWNYRPELLRPFWQGETMEGESVLFIKDPKSGKAQASVLFPIREIVTIRNSAGDVTYENGKDYLWKSNLREITLPAGSRIPSCTPQELRRPAKTQKYELTHRDRNGEIFFGARLEYAEIQTCVTYRHALNPWNSPVPQFDAQVLPRSVARLRNKQPFSVLGDSISTGANASGIFDAAPFQPAYPELIRQHLEHRFEGKVTLVNLSVGGTDTVWALGSIDKVVEAKPNLLIVAFGMNDAAGRPAREYEANIQKLLDKARDRLPECEYILVAPILGNRDWTRLQPELFPQYRDKLKELTGPGVALADLTSIWAMFSELKQDWDQTGNGVNHPNDFGHRVYAQVISSLLVPPDVPSVKPEPPK